MPTLLLCKKLGGGFLCSTFRSWEDRGEALACREMRKHASAYFKGIPYAARAKQALVQSTTYAQYEEVFEAIRGEEFLA